MSAPIADAATALFVPGHHADRFAKAAASGADVVIIDWEDAVPPAGKDQARRDTVTALTHAESGLSVAVRINAPGEGQRLDLEALREITTVGDGRLIAVILPKAQSAGDVETVAAAVPGVPVVPLIENARGLAAATELAAVDAVVRLGFGALDFGVDVDAISPVMLDHARCVIVLASRAAGLASALDSPNPEFRDEEAVHRGAASARSLGMGGQLCIHPKQVRVVAHAFTPTGDEIAWAQRVVGAGVGASALDGAMIDRPVLLRAERILARAAR